MARLRNSVRMPNSSPMKRCVGIKLFDNLSLLQSQRPQKPQKSASGASATSSSSTTSADALGNMDASTIFGLQIAATHRRLIQQGLHTLALDFQVVGE